MKILHVIPSYKPAYIYAGVIESAARLCEGLAEDGHTVHVFTTTANGTAELPVEPNRQMDVDGVKVTYFKRITKDPTNVSPALWRYLWKHVRDYDVVHIHTWWNFLVVVATWICHLRNKKVILSPRGMLSQYIFTSRNLWSKKIFHGFVGRKVLKRTVFHATALSEYQECTTLIRGWKGFLLPNILLLPDVEIVRMPNPVFTLVYLSRIHPKKGLEFLFESIRNLPFDVNLKIAGSGDERYVDKLKRLAGKLGISGKVQWLGWKNRQDKFVELMKGDAFVLTSYNENFANVVIEALHMGTPVLISENVGLSSFIVENDLGWITTLDAESIGTAIIQASRDTLKRERINKQSREIIDTHFSQRMLIMQYVERYSLMNVNCSIAAGDTFDGQTSVMTPDEQDKTFLTK